jgi:hypothetical protein
MRACVSVNGRLHRKLLKWGTRNEPVDFLSDTPREGSFAVHGDKMAGRVSKTARATQWVRVAGFAMAVDRELMFLVILK